MSGRRPILPRPDLPALAGGRGGQKVPRLTGPPNSALRGQGTGRMFITDGAGKVIADVTRARTKPVIPGEGFGPKREPADDELELLDLLEKADAPG